MNPASTTADPSPSAIPQIRFSTADIAEHRRMAAWKEIFGDFILNIDVMTVASAPLHAEATAQAWPGLGLLNALHLGSGIRAVRARKHLSRSGDDIVVAISTKGVIRFSQLGREAVVPVGAAAAVLSTHVGEAISITPAMQATANVSIPRSTLAPLVRNLEDACVRTLPAKSVALLSHYLAAAQDLSLLATRELQHTFVTHVYDLVALALGATRDAAEIANGRGVRAARLRAIKDDIRTNLLQPDLSVDTVAKRHGISTRYVHLLFQGEETSFSDLVRTQRLARAYRMLTSPQYSALKISAVAFDAGFSDLSHFNRAFRHAYGSTPSEARAAAAGKRGG